MTSESANQLRVTLEDDVAPVRSGFLAIVNLVTRRVVRTIDLGGQPDSIAISKNRRYAAVVVENERNEDLDNGIIPQDPRSVWTLALTGARPGVINSAELDALDFTRRIVNVRGKSGARPIVIPERLVPVLRTRRRVIGAGCGRSAFTGGSAHGARSKIAFLRRVLGYTGSTSEARR